MADKKIFWSKKALTGGTADSLDVIDGTALQDGEVAHVFVSGVVYVYLLDDDSGAEESSPRIITPDTNAGTKRWILQGAPIVFPTAECDMLLGGPSPFTWVKKTLAEVKAIIGAQSYSTTDLMALYDASPTAAFNMLADPYNSYELITYP